MMYNERQFAPTQYMPAQYRGVRAMPEQVQEAPSRGLLDYANTALSTGLLGATKVGGSTVAGHIGGAISCGASGIGSAIGSGASSLYGLLGTGPSSAGGLLAVGLSNPIGWAALAGAGLYGLGRTKFGKKIGRNISRAVGWKPPSQWF